jgi:uncharacterized OsmC-like protein
MTRINDIDIDILGKTIAAVKDDPDLAKCRFRAANRWLGGNRNVGRVRTFYAAKQELEHRETFEVHADEPPILAGDDSAANPVEHLLTALASCLTTSMVAHAAVQGIDIEMLESEVEGEIDLNGYLGLKDDVPRGYQNIRIKFTVASDADTEQLHRLAAHSPVLNTLLDGVHVDLQVEKPPSHRGVESTVQPDQTR